MTAGYDPVSSPPVPTGYPPHQPRYSHAGYQPSAYAPPGHAQPGLPPVGYPTAGPAPSGGVPPTAGSPAAPRAGNRLARAAFVLVVLLLFGCAGQTYFLIRLNQGLAQANRASADTAGATDSRLQRLEARANELEQRAGRNLDAAAVAEVVKPSVFRVLAGDFSGTAFAFGKAPTGGGTDLLTNFHVVERVYDGGGREVALERDNKRYKAKIVKVGNGKDMALLHTSEAFPRLQSASVATPGQPVVVIGAPLGLQDTVTTGVVSALRNNADGPVLQFDAPINPGNSGGPVIDAQKQVVGIATAKARTAEGIGLAIPIAVACETFANC